VVSPQEELEYWRALAEERGTQLERLRARLLAALEAVPDSEFERFASIVDGRETGWMTQLRDLSRSSSLDQDDVLSTLDDLWARLRADRT
jgi:hypothetical protein